MSYRQFLNQSLNRDELKEKNRNAPEGHRFCNGLCFNYLPNEKFSSFHVLCNNCRNIMNIVEQKVHRKQITIEDFKKDPMVIYQNQEKLPTHSKKTCENCKEEKLITNFEYNRKICKSCRFLQQSLRNKELAQNYIKDIEEIKDNIPILENFLHQIPKDQLILVISHYHIGRKSNDNKIQMIFNLVQHFKALLNPNLCKSGCGNTVIENLSICEKCKKQPIKRRTERAHEFTRDLDKIIEKLEPMDPKKDLDIYNKQELCQIAKKFNIGFIQSIKKTELFDKINAVLIKRQENRKLKEAQEELEKKQIIVSDTKFEDLVINEIAIEARLSDGFINATQLCKAGNKRFNNWYQLNHTKEFINELSTETGKLVSDLVVIKKGGNDKTSQGSWVHPDIGVQLASWISPKFAIRVSRWVREIVSTGTTQFIPKSNDELIKLQLELQENQDKLKKLETNHKNLLLKREYHKFKMGSCLYIIQVNENHVKIGYTDNLNERLKCYRTSIPNMKILFIIFTNKAHLLEQCLLSRYDDARIENNHEFLYDLSLLELTGSIDTICKYLKFDSNIISQEEIDAYNDC